MHSLHCIEITLKLQNHLLSPPLEPTSDNVFDNNRSAMPAGCNSKSPAQTEPFSSARTGRYCHGSNSLKICSGRPEELQWFYIRSMIVQIILFSIFVEDLSCCHEKNYMEILSGREKLRRIVILVKLVLTVSISYLKLVIRQRPSKWYQTCLAWKQ